MAIRKEILDILETGPLDTHTLLILTTDLMGETKPEYKRSYLWRELKILEWKGLVRRGPLVLVKTTLIGRREREQYVKSRLWEKVSSASPSLTSRSTKSSRLYSTHESR